MWFRQGTPGVDTDRIRASLKNRMRRFRSPDKVIIAVDEDEPDNVQHTVPPSSPPPPPLSLPTIKLKTPIIREDTDDENVIEMRRIANAAAATVQRSPSAKKLYKSDKEKTLLTDRKFKNKRISKSSSKSKISDADTTKVRGISLRKTSAPPVLDADQVSLAAPVTPPIAAPVAGVKKHVRSQSNLTLNSLLRYKLTNRKLSTADFERLRRKSVSAVDAPVCDKTVGIPAKVGKPTKVTKVLGSVEDASRESKAGSSPESDEEEVFLSASEDVNTSIAEVEVVSKKSPSLGARMAARFSDHSASKAKKANKLKKQKKEEELQQQQQEEHRRKSSSGSITGTIFKQNSFDRPTSTSSAVQRQPSDRRPDANASSTTASNQHQTNQPGGGNNNQIDIAAAQSIDGEAGNAADQETDTRDSSKSKSAPVSVNRSESYKERLSARRNRNNRRKTSDPSFSKTNDEHVETGINNANYPTSSNSSLSSSIDSPSASMEVVATPTAAGGAGAIPATRDWVYSDDESGELEADWSSNVPADILQKLSKDEKKRQEIINEIYQTERNHVRTLKLLEGIFLRPLQESGTLNPDHLNLLFPPALLILKDHHSQFEQQLKQRRLEHSSVVTAIGDLLLAVFGGNSGDELKEQAAHFCARQQIALEALKEKRRKDDKLHHFLTKAESHKACRRLQLKDLLPTALQRLTKYPLLFESLYTITVKVEPDNESEALAIRKALDLSKRILDHVNQAVRFAEDAHKLQTIQKKLDRSNYDKEASAEFKNLDLTQHKLLHDGILSSKKNPGVQLHGLLFENIMVLLQKLDDRYVLKYHTCPALAGGDSKAEARFNPISRTQQILGRNSAVDKNIFFLIMINPSGSSQMMELTAPSSSECKTWVKHINDAADALKFRTKNSEPTVDETATPLAAVPTAVATPTTKDSSEGTPDKELSQTASSTSNLTPLVSSNQHNVNNNNGTTSSSDAANGSGTISTSESNNNLNGSRRRPNSDSDGLTDGGQSDLNDYDRRSGTDEDSATARNRRREYSNNSNNTRTLTQQNSLVAPSEVQVSVSPALTAEPVLTLTEQLRRLDETIRTHLAEKQKIVCDMFRVPNEHFTAIADIVGQPEAPKDPSDIVLAVFAQVQSLNETHNKFIRVSPHQEISAVSTSICDECHRSSPAPPPLPPPGRPRPAAPHHHHVQTQAILSPSAVSTSTAATSFATVVRASNATSASDPAMSATTSSSSSTATTSTSISSDSTHSHHVDDVIIDDDGYCEIDELRLPAIIPNSAMASAAAAAVAELKRQSTISADSIPEETEHEIHAELVATDGPVADAGDDDTVDDAQAIDGDAHHMELNDTYDMSQTVSEYNATDSESLTSSAPVLAMGGHHCADGGSCGVNRLAHVTSIAPAVPCYLIHNIVTALNSQMTQLIPKLQERDVEREKLRKENQHLRELINAMHERDRVLNDKETSGHATGCPATSEFSNTNPTTTSNDSTTAAKAAVTD